MYISNEISHYVAYHMSCAVDIYDSGPHFKWITRNSVDNTSDNSRINNVTVGHNQLLDSMRFTIQDLIQQECCIGASNYPVDKPSRLVQIECRKPGCRCVLKNERALAMKIVPGVTLVQAEWLLPNSTFTNAEKSPSYPTSQNATNITSTNRSIYTQNIQNGNQVKPPLSHSVVLTSCCPSWFELVQRSFIGPLDNGPQICPEVPVWSSCKAVWRARPKFILLRKDTQCLFATNAQSLIMSSAELLKKDDRSTLTLDADNIGNLRPGTVLQLIDCRSCRLVHKEDQHSSYRLSTRYRSKPVSMLQCSVVGGKALAAIASRVTNLSSQDALNWFSTGPRLVYLSLASKSIMCSPVKITSTLNTHNPNKNSNHSKLLCNETDYNNGVHSILSLLSTYRLPLITRPVVGLRSSEWFFMGKLTNHSLITSSDTVNMHSLLQIFSCHHGDLIFLEPLSDCTGSIYQNEINDTMKSRFFVVTTDMLLHHNFLVADTQTCQVYNQQLETHAFRVSHFLAACHPVQGLTYILKHLEDITHSSNTGPSYIPLTRTLGPITKHFSTIAIQSAVSSIAAIASLAMHEEFTDIPNDLYQLNEIQPKVLNYLILHNNNNNSITTTNITKNSSNNYNTLHKSSTNIDDFYHSTNCLTNNNTNFYTPSSLSSSLFTSEMDEMNALCDEIEDIYFYVRNGHFPIQLHSLSSLLHNHHYHNHEERYPHMINNNNNNNVKKSSYNSLSHISPHLNKVHNTTVNTTANNSNSNNNNNQYISLKKTISQKPIINEHVRNDNNNNSNSNNNGYNCQEDSCQVNNNFPVKITSKAPVLLIRPKPYHNNYHIDNVGDRTEYITQMITTNCNPLPNYSNLIDMNNVQKSSYQVNKSLLAPTSDYVIKPIEIVYNKPQVFSYTCTPVSITTTTTITTTKCISSNSLLYSSGTCNYPINDNLTNHLTASFTSQTTATTAPITTIGYHSTENISKLNENNEITCTYVNPSYIQQPVYSIHKQHSPGMFYCTNLPGVTLTPPCSSRDTMNPTSKPLLMTSLNISSKQNCIYYKNENKSEECIYDEPKEEYLLTQQQQHEPTYNYVNSNNNSLSANILPSSCAYDYGCSISSPNHSSGNHLSLSTSHIYPPISKPMYESDMSYGNVWTPSSHIVNNENINNIGKNSTRFNSTNNMFNDKMTTTVNCKQIIPSMSITSLSTPLSTFNSIITTTSINRNRNNQSRYFESQNQPSSCMTTSFRHQSVQNSISSVQQPPSMPLLYPLPLSPKPSNHTSRLYQSAIISPSTDKKQITVQKPYYITRPSKQYVTSMTNLNFNILHQSSTTPSPLPTMLLQSPKLKRTDLINSSPDTGIGIESTGYDQQTISATNGSFMPLHVYHSLSSSNIAIWSSSSEHYRQYNRDTMTLTTTTTTTTNTITTTASSYHHSPDKHFTKCKLTTFSVHNNHLNNNPISHIIINTTTNNNNSNNNNSKDQHFNRF
ncbi:hypothetical protein MN116_007587 [Schistosoma mekongi]|uniref:Uncharacterized protein n=1 Tax=Schistosoma mekongi TaxID=38744 RepID=A0AAE1Z7A3_SCHME|nr:hypothetical protein MN116_007587 [Schistosoma mekongi]